MGTFYSVDGTTGDIVTAGSVTAGGGITSTSTTEGFLLPSMTTTQRNAIVSPATVSPIVYSVQIKTDNAVAPAYGFSAEGETGYILLEEIAF